MKFRTEYRLLFVAKVLDFVSWQIYFYQHLANCMHLRVSVHLFFVLECLAVIKVAQSYGDLLNSSRTLLQEVALN